MPRITIDKNKCKGCFLCISVCPKGLISVQDELNKRGVKAVKFSSKKKDGEPGGKCIGCAMCAIICPDCCIEVYK